jgi:type I restriction enzyme S subunit
MKKQNEDIFEPAIPVVPQGWDVLPFELAVDVISDKSKRVKQSTYLPSGKLPVIDQGQDFIGGYTDDEGMAFEGELPVILFGDHTLSIKYVDRPFAVGAEGVKILKPSGGFDPKYLYYLLRSLQIPSRGYSRHFQFLRKFHFPRAPEGQQKQIVAEIEKQFSRLDEAVANLKRVKANLKRYKAAVLKAAVEGRLVETEAELARRAAQGSANVAGGRMPGATDGRSYETGAQLLQRILETRRSQWKGKSKYKEPAAPDTTDLPELPEGWVWASVEQMADVGTGATPLRSKREYYDNGKIPWVTSGALNEEFVSAADEYITDLAVQATNAKVFPAHTLLVAMYGEGKTRGKVSELLIEAATNQACAAIVLEGLSAKVRDYIKLFFLKNYEDIRRLSSGGVQPNLNLSHIKVTAIPLAPLAEQNRIVAEVDRRLSLVCEVESQLDSNHKRAERLRQSILKTAFSAELVVHSK